MPSKPTRPPHTTRNPLVLAVSLAVTVALILLGLPASGAAAISVVPGDVVNISTGAIHGKVTSDHREFLGVPYAKPPVGNLRFHSPEPAASWSGEKDAEVSGSACAQNYPILGTLYPSSEDCLTVNVYTPPAAQSQNLPVMVWFYGGAYIIGSAGSYDPTPLVTSGKVIVVEVNYRLGPFGFLALPGLAGESSTGSVGNYGLQDQQLALHWVKQNAAAFGGNPGNVTLFGQSAGGNSVCHQVASPLAAGLFQRVISESGACTTSGLGPLTRETAYARGLAYAKSLGCTDASTEVSCLRGKSQYDLLNSPTTQFTSIDLTFEPVIDGSVVRSAPDVAIRNGTANDVQWLLGTTHDEGRFFIYFQYHLLKLQQITPAIYTSFIRTHFPNSADAVLAHYPLSAYSSPDLAFSALLTDSSFTCTGARTTAAAYRAGKSLYQYEFDDPSPPQTVPFPDPFGMPLGDYHTSELGYLFSKVQDSSVTLTDTQKRLSAQMIAYWTNFARTGNPNPTGTSVWPAWTPLAPAALRLTSAGNLPFTTLETDHQCPFWATQ
jgi:para-nitrobenzyl esterase